MHLCTVVGKPRFDAVPNCSSLFVFFFINREEGERVQMGKDFYCGTLSTASTYFPLQETNVCVCVCACVRARMRVCYPQGWV